MLIFQETKYQYACKSYIIMMIVFNNLIALVELFTNDLQMCYSEHFAKRMDRHF